MVAEMVRKENVYLDQAGILRNQLHGLLNKIAKEKKKTKIKKKKKVKKRK
jgi:hypothetical protein